MSRGKRPDKEISEIKWTWEQRMHAPEFNEMSMSDQAKELGVNRVTIGKWYKESSPAFWKNVAETIRNQYTVYAPSIDKALIREAQGGSLGHQELFYKRFEGWSPTQRNENVNRNADLEGKSDEELQMEMLRKADPELLRKVLGEKKAPGVVGDREKDVNG